MFSPNTFSLGLAVLWNNPLIKDAHVGKEKHFTTPSPSRAEQSLPDFCWSSAEGQWELLLGDISGIPGQAWHVLSPGPPPGPAACWPMLRTPPSVLPPVGKLANEAAQAALPWSGRLARGWRRRRVAVVRWGMLPGVSESHSITLSSWALLRRAAGTSRSHLGRSGAWQGAAGRLQLLFKPWQQSSISVSQQEMQGAQQSRT